MIPITDTKEDAKAVKRAVDNGADLQATIAQRLSGKRVKIPKRKTIDSEHIEDEEEQAISKVNYLAC